MFVCPIDGKELAEGEPCPDHGIAFTEYKPTPRGRSRAESVGTVKTATTDSDTKPKRGRKR